MDILFSDVLQIYHAHVAHHTLNRDQATDMQGRSQTSYIPPGYSSFCQHANTNPKQMSQPPLRPVWCFNVCLSSL